MNANPTARPTAMNEHVETLKKVRKLLQNTPALQGREHIGIGIAFNNAIDHFSAPARNTELIAEISRLMNRRCAIGGTEELAQFYRDGCVEFIHRYDAMLISALASADHSNPEHDLLLANLYASAQRGFHVSESCGPENYYRHTSKFKSMEDLHAFGEAWQAVMIAARDATKGTP